MNISDIGSLENSLWEEALAVRGDLESLRHFEGKIDGWQGGMDRTRGLLAQLSQAWAQVILAKHKEYGAYLMEKRG